MGFRIKTSQFIKAAQEIAAFFPGETVETYYMPYKPSRHGLRRQPARGKLWSRYINLKAALRIANAACNERSSTPINSETVSRINATEKLEEKLSFLKVALEPFDKILSYWEDTYDIRKKAYGESELYDIFKEFPCLKLNFGIELVSN